MSYLQRAVQEGQASIAGEGPRRRITYHAANQVQNFSDPEEQVRAEFWAELIYRYVDPRSLSTV